MSRQPRSAATRERILTAASAAFRGNGFTATGVDAVMSDAGLTHGGFYAHFSSKADLLTAVIAHSTENPSCNALFSRVAHLQGIAFVEAAIAEYLSRWHRDNPADGCTIPTLGAELPRISADLGAAMGRPVLGLNTRLRNALPPPEDTVDARAAALLSLMVGGVITARTLPDSQADAWLASCRESARRVAGLPS